MAGTNRAAADAVSLSTHDILDRATALILQDDLPQAGMALLESLGPFADRNGRAMILRMAALAKLGGGAEFDHGLARILARPNLNEALKRMCQRLLQQESLPITATTLHLLWGPMLPALMDTFLAQEPTPMSPAQVTALGQTLTAVDRDGLLDLGALVKRAAIGRSRSQLAGYLSNAEPGTDALHHHFGVTDFFAAVIRLLVPPNLAVFDRLAVSGETAIVLQVHAGVNIMISEAMNAIAVPMSMIANADSEVGRPGDFNIKADDEGMAMRFAKLCQMMRKGPRVVRIFPDGRQGSSFAVSKIAGHRVEIGLGAASLAYYGKSTFYFARTRWTETGIAVDFTRGPKVDAGDSKAQAEEKFVGFYAESVTDLLRGDPVDFGLRGGFWKEFLTPRPDTEAQK